jgi:hypothetical protein
MRNMNREAFELVYIHANCLAELALDQAALDIELGLLDEPPEPALSAAERDARVSAMFDQMDPAASLDAWVGGPQFDAQVLRGMAELEHEAGAQQGEEASAPDDGPPDLGLYLQRAYAARADIAARVDAARLQIDSARLEGLLAALADAMAPLTRPLSADELAHWLIVYQCGNQELDEVVALVRGAEALS